jgi:threonine aldolase
MGDALWRLAGEDSGMDRPTDQQSTTENSLPVVDESSVALDEEVALTERSRRALMAAARWLPGMMLPSTDGTLQELATEARDLGVDLGWDRYGEHGPVTEVEKRVTELLKKPAAAMFPSGIMAQQSVLRTWTDRQGSRRVAIPHLSHLLVHEMDGPQLLNGFIYERLTHGERQPTVEDLKAIPGELGAVLIELPLRDGGYKLPTWDELVALSQACRERGVPLHFDGARLWESAPHLRHSLAEVAALADTLYVSFYKGLGGLAGAAVAGPKDVIEEARRWRTRHGGTLFSMLPYALAALRGMREQLPRMAEYHQGAVDLASLLQERGLRVSPDPPHTNAFRIYVEGTADAINERRLTAMEQDKVVLCWTFSDATTPGWSWAEFNVRPATMEWDLKEAADAMVELLAG